MYIKYLPTCAFLLLSAQVIGPYKTEIIGCGEVLIIYTAQLAFVLQNDENTGSQ